jgi:hypothetical protein
MLKQASLAGFAIDTLKCKVEGAYYVGQASSGTTKRALAEGAKACRCIHMASKLDAPADSVYRGLLAKCNSDWPEGLLLKQPAAS